MADVNANIGVHIDTSAALAELKNLQRQLATFHGSIAKGSAASAMAQKSLQTNLLNSINATGKFTAQMGLVRTSTESFTHALEKNKLGMREYFRYAGGATKTFGKLFRQEFDTINKVAEDRVKKMQTQYIKMGRDANGAMKAMAIQPTTLNMKDLATQTAIAAQRQALFNQLVRQGSTNLLNFGKNTQWAGRQLMVGFTVPLMYLGGVASKVFMDLEAQALKFKRVYGDMFTTSDDTNKALEDVKRLAEEFTKYGVAVSKTMEMAASAAAMGKTGTDLTAQVANATRLAVLGNVEQEQALETTISLTNAFGIAADDLAKKINFLNSVENQTVVSIEDLTIAIPKAGPVVKQLGGDIEDLAFFLTAMKEGGINASEGANALKSGLASLINPSKKAAEMLAGLGINIKGIVEANAGDLKNTVIGFAQALDTLDPLNKARAIEQLFGKFQFARLSTLFQNVTKDGTQASKVLQLAGASVEELAILSERELKTVENAVGTNFKESVEKLKLALAPIGEVFLKTVTPIVKIIGDLLDKFNNLGDGTKKFIVVASTLVGIVGPTLLMTFGLLANGAANIIKLFLALRMGFLKAGSTSKVLAEQTSYMNSEQLEAATVAASLNQAHTRLTQSFTAETSAVRLLRQAYIDATVAAANFARANPGMMMPGKGNAPKKFARGATYVPGKGNKDTVPSVLTPGEAVIPKDIAQDPRFQPIIDAMVNGKLQAFGDGTDGAKSPYANSPQFKPKLDLSGPSAQVLNNDPNQVMKLQQGLPRTNESDEKFAARSAALLEKMNARKKALRKQKALERYFDIKYGPNSNASPEAKEAFKNNKAGFKDIISRLVYDDKTKSYAYFDNKGQQTSTITAKQLEQQIKYTFKEAKSQQGNVSNRATNPSTLNRYLGRVGKAGTGAPAQVRAIREKLNKQYSPLDAEGRALRAELKNAGLSEPEIKKFMGSKEESHILKPKDSKTKWQSGHTISDHAGLNNYLNRAGGTSVGKMVNDARLTMPKEQGGLGLSQVEVKKLKEDYAFAQSGKHPTNPGELNRIARLAGLEVAMSDSGLAKVDKIFQAKGVLALSKVRTPSYYKDIAKRIIKLGPTPKALADVVAAQKGERQMDARGREKVLTGQNTGPKPASVKTTSRNVSDNRVTRVPRGGAILPKGFRIPGAESGFVPNGPYGGGSSSDIFFKKLAAEHKAAADAAAARRAQAKDSIKVADVEKQFRAEQKSLRRQLEKIEQRKVVALKTEEKELKKQSETRKESIKATQDNTKQTITAKEKVAAFSGKAGMAVGAMSGLTIAASFAGGSLGEMAQKIMPFVFGLQGILALLPMLMNPWVALIAATTALVVGAKLIDSNNKKMAQKQSDYIDSVSATTDKMKKVGEVTGKVGASELMERRRADSSPDAFSKQYNRAGQQFGTNFMGSEIGKEISKGFSADLLANGRSSSIKQFALQLSGYVSDGVIDGVQAGDIARQIAVDFQDMTLYPAIIGELTNLIGPDGANLLKDPLKVRLEIIKGQKGVAESFQKDILTNSGALRGGATLFSFGAGTTERLNQTEASAAATSAAYSQSLELAKAQIDATNAQYQKDLQVLETKKNIAKTEKDRVAAQTEIDTLTGKNKKDNITLGNEITKILKAQETAFDKVSNKQQGVLLGQINYARNAFIEASKQQVAKRFKGTKLEEQIPAFLESTKNLKSQDLEIKINAIAASGTNPVLLGGLMRMFKGDEKTLNKQIDIGIATRGIDETTSLVGSLAMLEDDKLQKELFLKINAIADKGKFADIQSTLTKISEMAGKDFDVNTYLKVNGFAKLDALSKLLRNIQNIPDPIVKTTQLENTGISSEVFQGIVDNWEYFMSLPETVRKNAITTYTTAYDMVDKNAVDAEIKKRLGNKRTRQTDTLKQYYATPAGQAEIKADLAAQATKPQYSPAQPKPKTAKQTRDDAGKKGERDTTLDELLKKLKLTRDASINAEGGLQELRRVFKKAGGDIAIFKGLEQALSKLGADSGFIDFIGGMDNATEKGYVNAKLLKKGIVDLTDDGKLALKGYQEAMLGAFSSSSAQAINELQKQRSGFVALKASGLDSADALEMISDANFAVSLSAAKTTEEVKKLIAQFRLQRKEADLTLAATDPQQYFKNQRSIVEQDLDVQERIAKLRYEPEIAAMEKLVDANNELIEVQQRRLETDDKIGSRRIEIINNEIEALQRSLKFGIDETLQSLQNESTQLSEDQTTIAYAVDSINEKYDLQEKALNKISDINQEIVSQQKSQLNLADALSQGDIAAAAAAAQEMRATSAAAATQRASGLISAAREAEIAGVRGAISGLTADQISERQYQIDRQTYTLNQQRAVIEAQIEAKQEQIYQIEVQRKAVIEEITRLEDANYILLNDKIKKKKDELKAELDAIQAQRDKWDQAQLAIDLANTKTEKFQKDLEIAKGILERVSALWTSLTDKNLKLTIQQIENAITGGQSKQNLTSSLTTSTSNAVETVATAIVDQVASMTPEVIAEKYISSAQAERYLAEQAITSKGMSNRAAGMLKGMLGMSYGGMVPKYMAVGGKVGSDTVPAMLTPGEFVMNKAATKRFGPLLENINNSKYPSMIKDLSPTNYTNVNSSMLTPVVNSISTSVNDNSSTMYNYSVGINVNESNANSNDIARAVIGQIKYIDSQRIRGQK